LKPGDPALDLARNFLIRHTNHRGHAGGLRNRRLPGLQYVAPLTCMLTGEAREAAKFLYGIAQDVRRGDAR
jgi:hydroxypyruvate reductase